ncbi:MAG: SDR family NAD(P)-dependent oxidoreductase [Deltaproteobacteria bacterium]|nr:SDR family NAD(P)-dependent oxidoreductase [Deltaproteobacteria bacterium]
MTAGLDLAGKTVLITGVNSGLGQESARVLAMRGARILGAARSTDKAAEACRAFGRDAVPLACELADPDSVRRCVASVRALGIKLDVVLCNAGIMALPTRELAHGQELQFLTNHIGHFILVTGLLDNLSDRGRVVMLSSTAHQRAPSSGIQFDDLTFARGYRPWTVYGHSKLANLLFARSLAKRFAGSGRTANAVHPGVISTNLGRHLGLAMRIASPIADAIALKTIPQGAATQCYVAARPELASVNGEYFSHCNVATSTAAGRDIAMAERLWTVTEKIVANL